jgi:hypothetical protein
MTSVELNEKRQALKRGQLRIMAGAMAGTFLSVLCVHQLVDAPDKPLKLAVCSVILVAGPAMGFVLALRQQAKAGLRCRACNKPLGVRWLSARIASDRCPQCGVSILDECGGEVNRNRPVQRSFLKAVLGAIGLWAAFTAFLWTSRHSPAVLRPEGSRFLVQVSQGVITGILLICIANFIYLPAKAVGVALRLVKGCTFRDLAVSFCFFLLLFFWLVFSLATVGTGGPPAARQEAKPDTSGEGNGPSAVPSH